MRRAMVALIFLVDAYNRQASQQGKNPIKEQSDVVAQGGACDIVDKVQKHIRQIRLTAAPIDSPATSRDASSVEPEHTMQFGGTDVVCLHFDSVKLEK